ncbi:hypothetical protein ASB1_18160 (plasmid) [Helicobacter heilmannii]|uniref:Uncharacterized protein n=1 Tax=Helicobacter heilmannii TaxID=35817 RepID=A0A0K2Y826_HELHE|nr:hypothetical protein [Helicobacter heilmannii]BDQ28140.1 hypothetical protein ASB1_18160 [Helicobacter heilmannii]CRI35326.1 hypothetical protein HHE01_03240 [Helicobacter heilmannii]
MEAARLDLETLLSQKRLDSYGRDLQAHLENLKLIGKYTHKIALVEIALRNSLDYLLSTKDTEWINNSTDPRVIQMRAEILEACKATALSHDSYLSKMTLGMVIHIIKREGLFARIFNAEKIQFKHYDPNYRQEKIFIKGKKSHLSNYNKAVIALSLFHNLRNRCYHWENITKTRTGKNGKSYPRLTTNILKILNKPIGITPDRIDRFLDDLLMAFSERLLEYANHP